MYPDAALNKAMLEAVEFIHAEGWDANPTLFALVPVEKLGLPEEEGPLALVVQDDLPGAVEDVLPTIVWPEEVEGVILAQEIKFSDAGAPARPARLYSGVLRGEQELTLLQLRPTEAELAEPFAEDKIDLRGGPDVAPGVIEALRYTLDATSEDY
ncbi:PPA1309 family protein [Corynebacterium sp. H128]|uniref:PPA1309 family protein n=1 Tax=unclassified Corynebacterium TaxID=2624378 RepID=UPI003097A874